MKKVFFALTIMLFGSHGFAQNTARMLDDYMAVKNALVKGDAKSASQALANLQQSINADGAFAQKNTLVKAAGNMAQADNIEKQRAAFAELSAGMWQLVKSSGKTNATVYYQYCPMKKAYWLSKEKEIKNPYYGSAMLTCGKVAETK